MRGLTYWLLEPLTFIGALNWGLIGIFKFNLVEWIFGEKSIATRVIYIIIGVAALIWLIWVFIDRPVHHER